MFDRRTGHIERAFQVHIDYCVPIALRHFVEHAIAQNTCGIDDGVETAKFIHGLLDHIIHALAVRHTVGVGNSVPARGFDFFDHVISGACTAIVRTC